LGLQIAIEDAVSCTGVFSNSKRRKEIVTEYIERPPRLPRSLVMLIVVGCISCSSDEPGDVTWLQQPDEHVASEVGRSQQPLTGFNKYCTVFKPNDWRDTLVVPDGWTFGDCIDWGLAIAGGGSSPGIEGGCFTETGFEPAAFGNSCNWE
jgi:hypothetical protein